MNALGNSLFHDVVNQTYKKIIKNNNNQYYADKSFGGMYQKTVLLDEKYRTICTYTVL
jgi:hypothetical protein